MTPRLARPGSDLKPAYDAIVVGSGYGGGVAACRLARSGQRVAVLERGREYLPKEFPANPAAATKALQVAGEATALGSQTALFEVRLGAGMHVLKACGLGGTSLINANVCLAPVDEVFDQEAWPSGLNADQLLAEGFLQARTMLRPEPQPGWRSLPKVKALEKSASMFGRAVDAVPIHVAFRDGPNAAGVNQPACTSCGDCCGGCNVGAKTTVANTYLADAAAHGADIFTEMRVLTLARDAPGKWRVRISQGDGQERTVSAPIVVLAAGTLGSTEILMRSRDAGLALSAALGERLTSNGDVIALAYNNVCAVNGIGVGDPPRARVPEVGAAVNGLIDLRRGAGLRDGIAIVECALPSSLAPLLPALLSGGDILIGEDEDKTPAGEIGEATRALQSLFAGAYTGALHNTQTFLAVAHDEGNGRMRLANDRLVVDWPNAAHEPVFQRIEEALKIATAATGGTYLPNPASARLLGGNLLTVHPLGGCIMADDRTKGVVNHKCQVFDASPGAAPDAVHAGLYVCDGSVIPCSLGVHPLLTITAVAERAMILLARDRRWETRRGPPPPLANRREPPATERRAGLLGWFAR